MVNIPSPSDFNERFAAHIRSVGDPILKKIVDHITAYYPSSGGNEMVVELHPDKAPRTRLIDRHILPPDVVSYIKDKLDAAGWQAEYTPCRHEESWGSRRTSDGEFYPNQFTIKAK